MKEKDIKRLKEKILNETTSACNECKIKEKCKENECVLYRIEQLVINLKEWKR